MSQKRLNLGDDSAWNKAVLLLICCCNGKVWQRDFVTHCLSSKSQWAIIRAFTLCVVLSHMQKPWRFLSLHRTRSTETSWSQRRHRPEAAKNGKLQPAFSYASFPLDFLSPTLNTSISLPCMQEVNTTSAGARILLNVSRGEGKDQRCLKKHEWEVGMHRGPQPGRGPLKGARWCFLRWIRQCVCPLSNPVRLSRNSNTISWYSSSGIQLWSTHTQVTDWLWVSKWAQT